jgi:uncharacterized protein YoxC
MEPVSGERPLRPVPSEGPTPDQDDYADRIDSLLSSALAEQSREKRLLLETVYGAKSALVRAEQELIAIRELMEGRDQALLELLSSKLQNLQVGNVGNSIREAMEGRDNALVDLLTLRLEAVQAGKVEGAIKEAMQARDEALLDLLVQKLESVQTGRVASAIREAVQARDEALLELLVQKLESVQTGRVETAIKEAMHTRDHALLDRLASKLESLKTEGAIGEAIEARDQALLEAMQASGMDPVIRELMQSRDETLLNQIDERLQSVQAVRVDSVILELMQSRDETLLNQIDARLQSLQAVKVDSVIREVMESREQALLHMLESKLHLMQAALPPARGDEGELVAPEISVVQLLQGHLEGMEFQQVSEKVDSVLFRMQDLSAHVLQVADRFGDRVGQDVARLQESISGAMSENSREKRQLLETVYGAKSALAKTEHELEVIREQMANRDEAIIEILQERIVGPVTPSEAGLGPRTAASTDISVVEMLESQLGGIEAEEVAGKVDSMAEKVDQVAEHVDQVVEHVDSASGKVQEMSELMVESGEVLSEGMGRLHELIEQLRDDVEISAVAVSDRVGEEGVETVKSLQAVADGLVSDLREDAVEVVKSLKMYTESVVGHLMQAIEASRTEVLEALHLSSTDVNATTRANSQAVVEHLTTYLTQRDERQARLREQALVQLFHQLADQINRPARKKLGKTMSETPAVPERADPRSPLVPMQPLAGRVALAPPRFEPATVDPPLGTSPAYGEYARPPAGERPGGFGPTSTPPSKENAISSPEDLSEFLRIAGPGSRGSAPPSRPTGPPNPRPAIPPSRGRSSKSGARQQGAQPPPRRGRKAKGTD